MADIKNKNELKRRIDLFIDDFSHEEYMINEPFCKETMLMMREFIGRASHLLDCTDAKIKKAKRSARAKAIDEFAEKLYNKSTDLKDIESDDYGILHYEDVYEVAEELKGVRNE